jgi:hypothetical protein
MRRISLLYNILSILVLGGIVSCSDDFTELVPKGGATESTYWQNESDALAGANALYYYMKDEDMFSRGFMWYINASDDMITGRVNGKADAAVNFNLSGDESYFNWMYPQSYKIIRRANDVIANVPAIDMDDDLKNRILGEAYFMRGFHYFWLAHTYGDNGNNGGVPIVTEENMYADKFSRPESVIDNYEQIVGDLKKAADLLPLYIEYSGEDLGRAHKDAAFAYIAKTYLYWAQYDASKWTEVVTYCDKLTTSGSNRHLIDTGNPETDYRNVFVEANDFGPEYIWSVVSGVDDGSKLPGVMLENKGWGDYNGWGYYQPSLELYNEFEEGDVRRNITILEFGQEFQWFGETRRYSSQNSQSGFQFNKYMEPYGHSNPVGTAINPNGNNPTTVADVPLIRYAEILLMKAEALLMQGENADVEINKVRDRAGLAPVTGATMDNLKHERRVELAGEFANRHFDLVRWGDADEAYALPLHGREHENKTDPDSPYTIKVVREARPQFDPDVHHVWLIPNEVIDVSGIEQNKGWK